MSSAHPSIRKLVYRFAASVTGTPSSVHTISGVPEKGHIAGVHVTAAGGTVTPIISAHSGASEAIDLILEYGSALAGPDTPSQPVYYEAHNDSGVFKIYLKPVCSASSTNVSYRIDIWPVA